MVYESYPWKQDLLRRKRLILKYNTVEYFQKDEEATYTVLEKAIFYSAFIIRKLIDCFGKLSDDADRYTLSVIKFKPLKEVNAFHRWPDESTHDWDHSQQKTVKGKDICNWLIHSYLFFFNYNEEETIDGFFVASDYDRNKTLYYIRIRDWLDYMTFIASDDVVKLVSEYDMKAGEYVYTKKERGTRK